MISLAMVEDPREMEYVQTQSGLPISLYLPENQESIHKYSGHTATAILEDALPRTRYSPAVCVSYRLLGENAV